MKKLYFLLLFLVTGASAQIVNIPDAAFKNALLNTMCVDTDFDGVGDTDADLDNDGEISELEAQQIMGLFVANQNISSLEGIAAFSQMSSLDCSMNVLTSLDLSSNPILLTINCQGNLLADLVLPQVADPEYRNLNAAGNLLTTVDLKNAFYEEVNLSGNQLTAIGLLQTPQIYEANFQDNQLTSFVQPPTLQIGTLWLNENPLTFFSIPPTNYEALYLVGTQLELLDLGNLTHVEFQLVITNNPNLLWVNLANGDFNGEPGNTIVSLVNNPQLQTVCVDDIGYTIDEGGDLIEVSEYISVTAAVATGVNVTTYCSFTPAVPFNTVSGVLRYDLSGDGCDASDPVMSFVRIDVMAEDGNGAVYTNQNGEYVYHTTGDTVMLHPVVDTNLFMMFMPILIDFSSASSVVQDFCAVAENPYPDLEIAIAPLVPARPGFEAVYNVTMRNKGTTVISQPLGVSFTFDGTRMQFVSASQAPDAQTPGMLSWDYSDFMPFESRSITVTFNVNSPTDTPPVNSGDVLDFNAAITPQIGDFRPYDNQFSLSQTVVASYDPNNKLCLQGGVAPVSQIGDYMHYVINFENTGTFAAQNIVVKDAINPAMYDLSTLQILDASHQVAARVRNNAVEFIFEGINLEIGGHGNILLKVKSLGTLAEGDSVANEANIYFDYNHPVLTDTAITLFESLKVDEVSGVAMSVWPNPSAGIINLKSASAITKIELYDVQGRLLLVKSGNSAQESIDLSPRTNGIYILRVTTPEGIGHVKLVRN